MIATVAQARALLRRRGAMPLTGAGSLVAGVTGGPVRGSWWGHPKGGLIYRLASALEDAPGVLVTKLAAGRVTFVDRALWPALCRIVEDQGWRREASAGLPAAARRLLERVAGEGAVRLDRVPAAERAGRAEVERRALVRTVQVHTESGKHATVVEQWRFDTRVRRAAGRLSIEQAREQLAAVGIAL